MNDIDPDAARAFVDSAARIDSASMDGEPFDWAKTIEVSGSIELEMTREQAARLFAAYVPPRGEIVGGPLDGLPVQFSDEQ